MISRELYKPMDSRKSEVNGNQAEHAKLIEKQNKEYYELFDNLSQLSEGEQDMILLANFQLLPASRLDVSAFHTAAVLFLIQIVLAAPAPIDRYHILWFSKPV